MLPDFAVGHSQETAAGHYADIATHRELHERTVENGLAEALAVALPAPVVLDEDGHRLDAGDQHLTPDEVTAAMSSANDVWLASCRDFYDSPFARTKKTGCPVAIWGCLECPNAVFSTRHLPSVLSFLSFCEAQREEIPEAEWTLRYGLAWQRIVHGIQPRFTPEQIRTARAIAEGAGPTLSLPTQMLEHLG